MKRPRRSAWIFPEGTFFPIVGRELHPLKRFAPRVLYRGLLAAVALHILSFGGWLAARHAETEPGVLVPEHEFSVRDSAFTIVPPPSIRVRDALDPVGIAVAREYAIGVPEPVPDFKALSSSIASMDQLVASFPENDPRPLVADGDTIDLDRLIPTPEGPATRSQVFDELPVAISMPRPVYPDLARSAGIEGTVLVSALITPEGKVGEVKVIEGNLLLRDETVAAVKTWIFRPALHQHRPVQVWVNIPVDFAIE